MPATPQLAVFGHPIAHSRSPHIHAAFGHQLGIDLSYRAIDVPDGRLAASLARFAASGGIGANVTLPFKRDAVACCADLSARARRASVVNTLQRRGDAWFGDNTDGQGLVQDITERHRLDLRARRVLILGAGGASQAILPSLLDASVDTITLANRNPQRADALCDLIGEPARVRSVYWEGLADAGHFDLVINATSAGVQGQALDLPFSLLSARTLAYDLSYGASASLFLAWARAGQAWLAIDGLGMLVEQAALSFELWFGEHPDTELVFQDLRARAT
ncbi:MAG: shikimate dehydrogenase [Ahniella sp.]|nr:shikimate dehydrogenase [Ahniella sp.]